MRFLPAVEMTWWRHVGLRSNYDKRSMMIVTMRFLPLVEMTTRINDIKHKQGKRHSLHIKTPAEHPILLRTLQKPFKTD